MLFKSAIPPYRPFEWKLSEMKQKVNIIGITKLKIEILKVKSCQLPG